MTIDQVDDKRGLHGEDVSSVCLCSEDAAWVSREILTLLTSTSILEEPEVSSVKMTSIPLTIIWDTIRALHEDCEKSQVDVPINLHLQPSHSVLHPSVSHVF